MGEGLRNTISLRGSGAAHGRLHWSENFDEVQDFEGQIRDLAEGTGLMADADFNTGTRSQSLGDPKAGISADLDALAAYVASLNEYPESPHRGADGSLTGDAMAGRDVFRRENCASCHGGTAFTDSDANILHDIGTLKPSSGLRLNGPLPGIDTPTLRGLETTAPYLHDGSAATLADAVAAHNSVSLSSEDLSAVVAYLLQIDSNEVSAPLPNTAPNLNNPGAQSGETDNAVSLPITASDADGDSLDYSASGLPSGLSINVSTGLISGTPDTAGTSTVTVTVSDGTDSVSTGFDWDITDTTVDTIAPSKPGRPSATIIDGSPRLSWTASTDNVGVVGYIVFRSTSKGSLGAEVGRAVETSYHDTSAQRRSRYYYRVKAYDAAGNLSVSSGSRRVRVR